MSDGTQLTPADLRARALAALREPGARRLALRDQLDDIDETLRPLVLHALVMEVPQRQIVELTGIARNTLTKWKLRSSAAD